MAKTIVLYHAGCPDGFGAAWSFYQKYGNDATYVPVIHGQKPPNIVGRNVFIVDFCYPAPIMKEIARTAASVVVLDHHITAQKDCGDLKYCHFDMTHSGAVLAWKHLFADVPIPAILQHIEDRDLWLWQHPNSEEILSVVDSHDRSFAEWDYLNKKIGKIQSDGWTQMAESGRHILKYKNSIIKTVIANSHKINILGFEIPAANSSCFQSEIGNILSETADYAAVYFYDGYRYRVSLRSKDSGLDVSQIAAEFGGGGHRNAAGFTVNNIEDLRTGNSYDK